MSIIARLFAPEFHTGYEAPMEYGPKHIWNGLFSKLIESSRISSIKKMDQELEEDINRLRKHVLDFNRKIQLVDLYMKTNDPSDLDQIRQEVRQIYDIISEEQNLERKEDKYVVRALRSIDRVLSREKDGDLEADEQAIKEELLELKKDVEKLQPVLNKQMKFFEMAPENQKAHIKELMKDIHEEALIVGYEEKYLKQLKEHIDKFEIKEILAE